MPELTGALIAAAFFFGWLLLTETAARRNLLGPEAGRKALHLGGGLGCLAFPLLVTSPLTVLLLATGFAVVFAWGERGGLACLSRVSRRSLGGLYFPFAVAGVFWLTASRPGLYVGAMLVLTLSDTAAALAGSRFGRLRFRVGGVDEQKSLEGSLMFFTVSFLGIFLPLQLLDGLDIPHAFLAALLTATLLTGIEAISIGGRDNLFVPMAAAFILIKVVTKPVAELLAQTLSLVVIFALVLLLNRRILRTRALVTAFLMIYAVWTLGSADWAVPLLCASAMFAGIFETTGSSQRATRVYRRMTLLASPAVALTVFANLTGGFAFFFAPYLAAVLVPLLWGIQRQLTAALDEPLPRLTPLRSTLLLLAAAAVLVFPLLRGRCPSLSALTALLLTVTTCLLLGWQANHRLKCCQGARAVLLTTLAAILLTGALQAGLGIPCWRPVLWADHYSREADVLLPMRFGVPPCT